MLFFSTEGTTGGKGKLLAFLLKRSNMLAGSIFNGQSWAFFRCLGQVMEQHNAPLERMGFLNLFIYKHIAPTEQKTSGDTFLISYRYGIWNIHLRYEMKMNSLLQSSLPTDR
jgi:hypothetical protein